LRDLEVEFFVCEILNFPAASGINRHFKPWPRPGFERPVSKKANYEFFLRPTSTPSVLHQGRL